MYILESCTSDSLIQKPRQLFLSWAGLRQQKWQRLEENLGKGGNQSLKKNAFSCKINVNVVWSDRWVWLTDESPEHTNLFEEILGKGFSFRQTDILTIVHQECSTGRWITILPAMCLFPTAEWCQRKARMVKKDRETSFLRKAKASLCLLPIVGDPVADITTWTSVQLMESFFYIEINRYPPNHMSTMPCLICDSVWYAMF